MQAATGYLLRQCKQQQNFAVPTKNAEKHIKAYLVIGRVHGIGLSAHNNIQVKNV